MGALRHISAVPLLNRLRETGRLATESGNSTLSQITEHVFQKGEPLVALTLYTALQCVLSEKNIYVYKVCDTVNLTYSSAGLARSLESCDYSI